MSQAAKQAKILLRGIFQRPFWQAWSLLLVGLVGTAVVAWETRKNLELTAKKQFQSACAEIQIKINDRFKAHELILRSGVAFYENSGGINRQAWHTFAEHHQLEQVLPGIQGLGFALLVLREQLARHLQEIRAEGFPEYQVRPEGDRAIYSSIIYLEPFTNRNLRAFGYDMLTEPVRREALERARDSGTAALTGKVTLVQETDRDVQKGTLMYLPVYRPGMSHATIAQRRESIIGWVYSPYRMNDLMRGILGKWEWMGGQRIRLQVFDGGPKLSPEALIFDSHPEAPTSGQQNTLLNVQSRFFAAGRSWVLNFTPDGRQAAAMDYGKVWIILICGLSISLMLYRLETLLLATRANAREMQLLIETNPDNVILKDGKGRWMVANEPAKKLFQLGDDESWHGKTDAELAGINPRLRMFHEACIKSDEQTWKEGRHSVVTEQGVGPDGKLQEHEVYKTPLFSPGGRRQGLVIIGRDMTARRQMERNLRCSEAMASQSRDAILRIRNSDGRILDANAAAESQYGYSRAELLAKTIYDLREKTDAAISSQQMSLAFGQGILFETVHVCKDGSCLPVEVSSQGIQLEGEACIISVIRDISARKKVEKRLQQLETAVAASATGIFLADRHGCITWANAAFSRLTGYANEEVMGCNPRFLNSGRHSDEFYKKMWGTILAGNVWKGELENRRKDGTIYFENKTITPVLDEAGKVSQFICVQEDVTRQKQAEAALIAANNFANNKSAQLKSILESPQNVVIFSLDASYCYTEFTQTHQATIKQIWGVDIAVGMNLLDIISDPADRAKAKANFDRVLQGDSFMLVEEYGNSSRLRTFYEDRYSPIFGNGGAVVGITVFVIDITERKRAEEELVKARDFHLQLLQNAPTLIWRAGTDAKCNWFNSTWLAFTGRTLAQEQGDGWAEGVHPEDLASCAKKYQEAFHRRKPFALEYRRCRHDGEYRWISDHGQPFDLPGGGFGGYIGYCYDIHESKLAHELLEKRVADRTREIGMLSEVIDQSSVAFSMSNPDGSFISVNEAYARLTGYSRAEILSRKLNWNEELTPPEWAETETLMVGECIRTRTPARYEKEFVHKDGRRFPVELFVQPVFDAEGKLIHLRAFVSDISERKKNAVELGDALLAAGRASRAKSEFLATMSHEIRTPMNIILGNTQLLQREPGLSKEVQNKLVTINRSGEHLLSILNDILDLAKIESGRMEVQLVEFKLNEFLDDLFSLYHAPAQARQLTFTIKMSGKLPESIQADQQKIRQIVSNLLSNAVKFTKTGGIELKVSAKPDAENKVWLNFTVTDSGPGIAPDELSHIFEKFHQGKLGRQSESGSGLGLAICQEYAHLMQGRISVQSELGKGSTFQFEVSVGIAFDTSFYIRENIEKYSQPPANGSGYRILIADDVTGNREVLREMVETAGFDCRTAANGAEALEIFAGWQPHLILMDTRMPVMGGLEAIRRIRASDQGQPVKIISISATAYPEDRAAAQAAGADYFISKPLKYDELIFRISGALGLDISPDFEFKSSSIHPAGSDNGIITAKLLAALPETWVHELREALLAADAAKIADLIKAVEPNNPEAANSLMKLAGQFDYEGMLEQLDKCAA